MESNTPKRFDYKKALSRAQTLCSRQEKSPGDLRTKLQSWGAEPSEISKIIESLTTDGFLNEERFARSYANDKARFNRWGPVKIKMMLTAKGISPDVIKETLENLTDMFSNDSLQQLIAQKAKTIKHSTASELKMKLVRFMVSRGHNTSTAFKAVEQYLSSR
ncbi:MAG: RecX family transcriptional regulator [Bacteroidales bacterium]|nr:RecX family transcriptional regulator [Bacteroidales bacterium]MBN2750414.1 RecX family transcriptional regulator [Bacteroidales bacterium]